MKLDENQMFGVANKTRQERADTSSLQPRVVAGQLMSKKNAARDTLQRKRVELNENSTSVCEQCQPRTAQCDGTLTQNAWQTTFLGIKSHVKEFWTAAANEMNRSATFLDSSKTRQVTSLTRVAECDEESGTAMERTLLIP